MTLSDRFRHDVTSDETGHYHRIVCTLCGWNKGTCGSFITDLVPLRKAHEKDCQITDTTNGLCTIPGCVRCHP